MKQAVEQRPRKVFGKARKGGRDVAAMSIPTETRAPSNGGRGGREVFHVEQQGCCRCRDTTHGALATAGVPSHPPPQAPIVGDYGQADGDSKGLW